MSAPVEAASAERVSNLFFHITLKDVPLGKNEKKFIEILKRESASFS